MLGGRCQVSVVSSQWFPSQIRDSAIQPDRAGRGVVCVGEDPAARDDAPLEDTGVAEVPALVATAELAITVANPALIGQFKPGEVYYVDFTPVPAAAT